MADLVVDSSVAVKWFVPEPYSAEARRILLALGVQENCQVVTADEKFVNAVGSAFPNLLWLANWK